MKNKILSLAILITSLTIWSSQVFGGAESENQRAKAAEKLFIAKQYEKAAPLYAQLISSNPKNFKYNYYYGICLLISGKDKSMALPYMEAAMQNPKTPEDIYYYMGRALHFNYRFDEALRSFTEFNSIIGAKNSAKWSTPQLMEMCNNAKAILDSSKCASIQEKTETASGSFYSHYEFTTPNGKLLSMPDELIDNSKSDKDESPMVFLSGNGRVMYYSAASDETNSRDIFRMEKDLDGNWGTAVRLDRMVNTPQDELFPTCNADGRILYFSSRGHKSTGGFDIFKAYYNTVSKTWTNPENMGSPYNSPDDDFCFVASTNEQTAYFTSQRETGPGSMTVYKVPYSNREELPIALNGKFNCIGQPDMKEIHLTITRDGEQNIVADITTDKVTGAYALELPGSGLYSFKVEAPGFQPHISEVRFGEFSDNIYVQDIFLSRSINGMEDLAISNRRLTESGLVDESLTADVDENGNTAIGMTAHDVSPADAAVAALSGKTLPITNPRSTPTDQVKVPALTDITFKVQIGAFRKNKREIVQARLEKKTDKTMLSSYDDLTWLRFFMGNEHTASSARNLKSTLTSAGFEDAFLVAFRNGKPMNLSEAMKLTKKK
ncbi:hypothetical protein BH11BAC2_BH11BAC2_10210 [soil metagenome]